MFISFYCYCYLVINACIIEHSGQEINTASYREWENWLVKM